MIELQADRLARGAVRYSLRNSAEFKEDEHPRAEDGKFGSGGSSKESRNKPDPVKAAQGSGKSPEDPKIISSQRYLDDDVVEQKKQELIDSEETSVDIPVTYVGDLDGTYYAMVVDHHHTMAAAKDLGLKINFVSRPDSEGLEGNDALEARYIDSSYYDIATGRDEF